MTRTATCKRDFARGDNLIEVSFEFTPGTPESGRFGPPEDYDPGSGPELYVLSAADHADGRPVELTRDEEDRFLVETLEDPQFDPFPDRD